MSDKHQEAYTKGKKQLVTTRESGYRTRANGIGYCGWKRQVHHVLPCVSANGTKTDFLSKQEEPGPAKRALERITVWDVNQTPNLIGLPSKKVYAKKFCKPFAVVPKVSQKIDPKKDPLIATCNWPVHLWNHPAYNREAKKRLRPIWANANIKIEQHKPVSAKNIKNDIQGVSDDMRSDYLEDAGRKRRRTQANWQNGNKAAFDII